MSRCLLVERISMPRWGWAALCSCEALLVELVTSRAAFLRRGAVDEIARHARVRAIRPVRLPGQLRAAHRLVDVGEDVHVFCLQVDAGQRWGRAGEILEQVGALATLPLFLGLCRAARDVKRVGDHNCATARNDMGAGATIGAVAD